MAITIDSTTGSASAASMNNPSMSWSHTIGSSDEKRILIVAFACNPNYDTARPMYAKYNNIAMTEIAAVRGYGEMISSAFYLIDPPTGTHNVYVEVYGGSWTGYLCASATSFYGVAQSSPIRSAQTTYTLETGPSLSSIDSREGEMLFMSHGGYKSSLPIIQPGVGAGQTILDYRTETQRMHQSSYKLSTGDDQTMSASSNITEQNGIAFSIKEYVNTQQIIIIT